MLPSPEVVREELRYEILRAHLLAQRNVAFVADGDLRFVDRERAQKRALAATEVARDLEHSLERLEAQTP